MFLKSPVLRRRAPRTALGALLAALLAVAGCAPGGGVALPKPLPSARALYDVPDLELRALLLLLADRRLFEPLTVERAFDGDEELRYELAVTLGRIGDRAGLSTLQALLLDESPRVRRAAVFSLGVLGRPEAQRQLLKLAAGGDRETAVLAVAALARCGTSVADVGEALVGLDSNEIWYRLLPSLYLFPGEAPVPLARLGLEQAPTPELKAWAAYALAHDPKAGTEDDQRGLLASTDPWQRALGAQALGRIGDGSDLERLRPLLADGDESTVIATLEAGARLVASARGAAPASW
ncbi:MAG: HEAT repeat domain-containing protein, partial [Acidobacteria bacterium]|nr:HEAT repeat domain-containing protein [Acidobacteriota bacterium]